MLCDNTDIYFYGCLVQPWMNLARFNGLIMAPSNYDMKRPTCMTYNQRQIETYYGCYNTKHI